MTCHCQSKRKPTYIYWHKCSKSEKVGATDIITTCELQDLRCTIRATASKGAAQEYPLNEFHLGDLKIKESKLNNLLLLSHFKSHKRPDIGCNQILENHLHVPLHVQSQVIRAAENSL